MKHIFAHVGMRKIAGFGIWPQQTSAMWRQSDMLTDLVLLPLMLQYYVRQSRHICDNDRYDRHGWPQNRITIAPRVWCR